MLDLFNRYNDWLSRLLGTDTYMIKDDKNDS